MLGVFVSPQDAKDRMRVVMNFPKDWHKQRCLDFMAKEHGLELEPQPDVNEPVLVAQMSMEPPGESIGAELDAPEDEIQLPE